MLDFVSITSSQGKELIVYPDFLVKRSNDLMIRGHSFYAVWDEDKGIWSTDENDVQRLIDQMIFEYADEKKISGAAKLKTLGNFSSNKWSEWQKYCKSLPDSYHNLDEKIIFSNYKISKKDYSTKSLKYPLEECPIPAYNELIGTLYSEEEREKIEWAIGSLITGDSKLIQKCIVLYGGPGTGKSTLLNIIQEMFDGYWSLFESKELGSGSSFGLESLKGNPLIAIEHDGDLSRIEDNTKLNSIISHEKMVINEKYKSKYEIRFNSFLFMGTNKPVKITDSKSGLIRRVIDVVPTGNKISRVKFNNLLEQIKFEYPGIAYHCLKVYEKLGFSYYDGYIPTSMMIKTNDFYNFIEDNLDLFLHETEDGINLNTAWARYKLYCEDSKMNYQMNRRVFKDELKNYFSDFKDRYNGQYSVYFGFLKDKFKYSPIINPNELDKTDYWLNFDSEVSLFDDIFKNCPAQYSNGTAPILEWDKNKSLLEELDTHRLHYVRPPINLIVIDFDLKNSDGNKDYMKNLEAASKWPKTYAELSKSGSGIHLHYYYDGDVSELSHIFDKDIEVKVFNGKSSLRRQLTKCNSIPIAIMVSGLLPLKEVKKTLKEETIKSEKALRDLIIRNIRKEIHPNTTQSIHFIRHILDEAYDSGLKYDVTDMRPAVQHFALNASNQAEHCLTEVCKMKFKSEEPSENTDGYPKEEPIVFFDVEVFPNLFLIAWKKHGIANKTVMYNPTPAEVQSLFKLKLVGFNNRDYDNHMLYARSMGYSEEEIFKLSQRIIIDKDKNAKFGEAYNLSYTDVYDFLSANNKMSLKKWEIKLGIHHHELGFKWDEPVPKEKWKLVGEYCCNDVDATEAVFDANQEDWEARQILAEWAGMTVNDTTNSLTTRLIVGKDPNPQSKFIYTDLSTIFPGYKFNSYGIPREEYTKGAKIIQGKSIYLGEDPGEGGKVNAKLGMHVGVAVLDIASMHPRSTIKLKIFGEEYTMNFKDIVDARVYIKHREYDKAKKILPEKLHHYLNDERKAKKLSNALKTPINSVYGLTSASFPNKLKDPRNEDNIVAKYGALFMINLRHEVEKKGWEWVHIKTDSIKLANATPEMINFVMEYGRKYGFEFEHESTYKKMCLVNESTYIALYESADWCKKKYGYIPENNEKHSLEWTATGTQFQVPYVFKTLFSHEDIDFSDLCETKSVTTSMYLDFNERKNEDEHDYRFVGKVGAFCPMKDGINAGLLLREGDNGKFSAVVGTKKKGKNKGSYRWMEAEMVKELNLEEYIDLSYYDSLVDGAVDSISKYCDFEWFTNIDSVNVEDFVNIPDYIDEESIPFNNLK